MNTFANAGTNAEKRHRNGMRCPGQTFYFAGTINVMTENLLRQVVHKTDKTLLSVNFLLFYDLLSHGS